MKTIPRCQWIIGYYGKLFGVCGAPATHLCRESTQTYCRTHAEYYCSIFGEDSLRELPIEEPSHE